MTHAHPQTPAEKVVSAFGSRQAVADVLGLHVTRVTRFLTVRERGGTGGLIPSVHQGVLLAAARQRGLSLTADDLIMGAGSESVSAHSSTSVTTPSANNRPADIGSGRDAA